MTSDSTGTPVPPDSTDDPPRASAWGGRRRARLLAGVVPLLAVLLVIVSLQRPEPPSYVPSPLEPRPAGGELVGPRIVTIDATDPSRWRYFSFSRGAVLEDPAEGEWDLAFRRFGIVANGGETFAGEGGILDLGPARLEQIEEVPSAGYLPSRAERGDSLNPAIERWYDYSFLSHLLSPKQHVWAVRTADGRHAALEILGYYCPGARPGCLTFRYLYQGGGGTSLADRSAS